MVYVFYYKLVRRLSTTLFDIYFEQLPDAAKKKVKAFRNWQDAERSLAGNMLLLHGLKSMGRNDLLSDIQFSEFQKPYINTGVNFNISHSGQYTICAISETIKVGIDVEEIKDIPLADFDDLFSAEEWNNVISAGNKLRAFYTLWTKKEAFLKAIGSGLNVPLNKVNITVGNKIEWQKQDWFLKEIPLDPNHLAFICTDYAVFNIQVTGLDLNSPPF